MTNGWTELGDGVWVRNYASLDLNIGVVAGEDGLAVIDTRGDAVDGREFRDDLRRLSPLPVGWVINTHHHWDHTWGNEVFDGVPIWGHVRCAANMRERGEEDRARLQEAIPDRADRFDGVTITPPNRTFERSASIDLGTHTAELSYLGRGHTDDDIVIRVAGITFAGDLVENGAPPVFGDAYPLDWPDTVAALLDLGDATVVPGHGPVADRTFVAAQHEQLSELAGLARERHAAGLSSDEAARGGAPFPLATAKEAFARAYLQLDGGDR